MDCDLADMTAAKGPTMSPDSLSCANWNIERREDMESDSLEEEGCGRKTG